MQTKILVLDDEKEIADLVALYLNNEGYEVHKSVSYTHLDVYKRQAVTIEFDKV